MAVTACAKRTLLSPVWRCTSSTLIPRTGCKPMVNSHLNRFCEKGRSNWQRRNLSASSTKKAKRSNKRKAPPPPPEEKQVPRWATTASILVVPFMFAAWGVSDWMFGNRNKGHNEELRQLFLREQRKLSGNDDDDAWLSRLDAKPTLFYCVIRTNSGLTHCLSGVRLGDVVDILEEGVGPNQDYNLCRLHARDDEPLSRDTYGWFPIRWLQKLDHYQTIARDHQRLSKKEDAN